MSVVARCACGNRISLADVMAGRTIPCPKCGGDVLVRAASGAVAPAARAKGDAGPSIHINPTILISAVVGVLLLIIALVFYFGPWTVGNQWAAMSPRANTEVTDVVQFALQAYESQQGTFDAAKSHNVPMVQGYAGFVPPTMVMTLPRLMHFIGKTNQGSYKGTYDTSSGEIVADIETGGWDVGGLVDVAKATGTFHMTGREKDGKVSAEVDGEPLQIVMRKTPPRE